MAYVTPLVVSHPLDSILLFFVFLLSLIPPPTGKLIVNVPHFLLSFGGFVAVESTYICIVRA